MEATTQKIAALLQPDVQQFIYEHQLDEETQLVLKHKTILGLPSSLIAQQIAGRKKARYKLQNWYNTRGIIYPPVLNLEQSSSEATARFKASLIPKGNIGIDLTGGLGIDSFFLSQRFDRYFHVDPDAELLELARHNHHTLGVNHIEYIHSTAEEFLAQSFEADFIFIDPSRRNRQQKVFKFADCLPDITQLLPSLLHRTKELLIKSSPLLDLQQGARELQCIDRIMVVAVDNEVKELLYQINQNAPLTPVIQAIDLNKKNELVNTFEFSFHEEKSSEANYSSPLQWIYEPNASLLKAGAFKILTSTYPVFKLHPNTHLYTSGHQVMNFPGRTFKLLRETKLDKQLRDSFANGQANIITRNFPLSVEEIKKKTGLIEGGEQFLICTQSEKQKHTLITERIK